MKIPFYMVRDSDQVIVGVMWHDDPDEGPVTVQAGAPEGVTLVAGGADFSRDNYLDTFVAKLLEGVVVWVDTQVLADAIDAAVAKCYPDIDAVYADAIGNRAVEYTDAETDARAFIAGGAVTENVSSFAVSNPTGQPQTNQWAAEQIIARADAFKTAQVAMRTQRFDTQSAIRACASLATLAQVVYLWDQFITNLRTQLGLP